MPDSTVRPESESISAADALSAPAEAVPVEGEKPKLDENSVEATPAEGEGGGRDAMRTHTETVAALSGLINSIRGRISNLTDMETETQGGGGNTS